MVEYPNCPVYDTGCVDAPKKKLLGKDCVDCIKNKHQSALAYIKELKQVGENGSFTLDYIKCGGGYCGSCRHWYKDGKKEPCKSCRMPLPTKHERAENE